MKLIVAGSRHLEVSPVFVGECVRLLDLHPTEIVCGCASGPDSAGKAWAIMHQIPLAEFPPDWERYGKLAGPIRNASMATHGDVLLVIWDGKSAGSRSMIFEMKTREKPIYEILVRS